MRTRSYLCAFNISMTIFQLKQLAEQGLAGMPGRLRWNYDRAEMVADGVVHAIGVVLGLVAAAVLITLAAIFATPAETAAVTIYGIGLVSMLATSATYNLMPISRIKWIMRRLDHSAIFILIAATYTPFIAQMEYGVVPLALLIGIWSVALAGVCLKLCLPGRFDRLSIGLYLAMGWSGMVVYDRIASALPGMTLALIAVGGILYSAGVVFHVWERLRFQNVIWHSFVLLGAACPYSAVLDLVLAA